MQCYLTYDRILKFVIQPHALLISVLLLIGGITGPEGIPTSETDVMTDCPAKTLNVPYLPQAVSRM